MSGRFPDICPDDDQSQPLRGTAQILRLTISNISASSSKQVDMLFITCGHVLNGLLSNIGYPIPILIPISNMPYIEITFDGKKQKLKLKEVIYSLSIIISMVLTSGIKTYYFSEIFHI